MRIHPPPPPPNRERERERARAAPYATSGAQMLAKEGRHTHTPTTLLPTSSPLPSPDERTRRDSPRCLFLTPPSSRRCPWWARRRGTPSAPRRRAPPSPSPPAPPPRR